MKRAILAALSLWIVPAVQSWTPVPSGTGQTLHAGEMGGRLAVGAGGTILYDGQGYVGGPLLPPNYQLVPSGTTRDLYGVHCINTCWVVGDSGTILRQSGTGMTSWTSSVSGTNKALRSVHFFADSDSGFAVGDGGTILKKKGSAWETISSGVTQDLNAVQFQYNYLSGTNPNRHDTGFAVGAGGVILKSTNRGASWVQLTSGVTQTLFALNFPGNSDIGFVVGASGTILKTTNRGTTWTTISSGTSNDLHSIVLDEQNGIIAGKGGVILKTADGGNTWTADSSGTSQDLFGGFWGGAWNGIVIGKGGTILTGTAPVSIHPGKLRRKRADSPVLFWSHREGLRLRDSQGRLYDLHGKRVESRAPVASKP
jgi:hypothetical protein